MSVKIAAALSCLLAVGCAAKAENVVPKPEAKAHPSALELPSHYLGEWFSVGDGSCRLLRAERLLVESPRAAFGRVADDLTVVASGFACRDASGAARRAQDLLREVRFVDERGVSHPLLPHSPERSVADALYFAVDARGDGLLRPRRYDARSGEPLYRHEARRARLVVPAAAAAIAPWPRCHDRALDHTLDRLARTLTQGSLFDTLSETVAGREAIEAATTLYGEAGKRFGYREALATAESDGGEGPCKVALTLGKSSQGERELTLGFELAESGKERAVVAVHGLDEVRQAIDCGERETALAARVARARQDAHGLCNVLGTLVPAPCSDEVGLVRETLAVAASCREYALLEEPRPKSVPADFAITLRRGRPLATLEPRPEYTLRVEASGRVQFASAHGEAEGRTSRALVSALYGKLERMRYFERLASDLSHCKANDARGDSLLLRAGGRERGVRDRDGCRGPFAHAELDALLRFTEEAAAIDAFTTSLRNSGPREPDVWIVAAD